jgi:hypothetical protein
VGEAASSPAFKMTPIVGAVGAVASPPAPEQDNAIVGAAASTQATRMARCFGAGMMRVFNGSDGSG